MQYQKLPPEKRCVILHPNAYDEHRFFQQYILQTTLDVVYIDVSQYLHTAVSKTFEEFVATAFHAQLDSGSSLDILSTTAGMLSTIHDFHIQVLFIDGCDGLICEFVQPILLDLIPNLPPDARVILRGRGIPIALLQHELIKPFTAIVPVDDTRLLLDYLQPIEDKDYLEVRSFGKGSVMVNGRNIERWEGYLPRALFFYFIDRAMTTRDEIFNTFWPDLTVREATNVFHVTKRKISEILGINLTMYGAGFYRIAPTIELRYDVVLFHEAVQRAAIADDAHAAVLYRRAVDLYREDFLTSIGAPWTERRRNEMRLTYTDAIAGLARLHREQGNNDAALGLFLRANAVAPEREDLARNIMKIYAELEFYTYAMEAYRNLEIVLKQTFGMTPDPKTITLMQKIKQHL